MRILCVTHAYPRWDGDVAGAFIERLNVALLARGHAMTVIAPADEGKGGEEERYGIRVHRVRYGAPERETLAYRGTLVQAARSPMGFVGAIGLMRALRRAVRTAPPADVIHVHWWIPGGLAVWAARRGTPYVLTLHGTDVQLLDAIPLARVPARRVARRAAAITAVSTFLGDLATRHGVPVGHALPMPVEVAQFARQSTGGGGVFSLGRLTKQKRIDLLLDALAHAARAGHALELTIIGDGPERAALERRAETLGVARTTRFLGAIAPERVAEVLAPADVFAFPARGEGYGLVVAEALMDGIPVVALADGGGALDIARPAATAGAARIVEPDDAAALATALIDLAGDSAARARAKTEGARLRAALAPERVAETYETVLAHATHRPDVA